MDPVADKLLIAAAFVTLVQFNPKIVPAWMVVIIVGREFLVSGLRSIAASEGFTIQASDLGKLKMFVQTFTVVAAIMDHHWASCTWPAGAFDRPGFHVGHGGSGAVVRRRLLRRLLEENRPGLGRPPAQTFRCA